MNTVPDLSYTVWATLVWDYMFTTLQSDYTRDRWAEISALDLQQRRNIEGLLEIVSLLDYNYKTKIIKVMV